MTRKSKMSQVFYHLAKFYFFLVVLAAMVMQCNNYKPALTSNLNNLQHPFDIEKLHKAAICGQIEMMQTLLIKGVDINARNCYGQTSLYLAIKNEQLLMFKFIVEQANVDVTIPDNVGWAPLHEAAIKGNPEIVKKLLERGTQINWPNNNDLTPLHLAVLNGHTEIVQLLLDNGARVNLKDKHRRPIPICGISCRDNPAVIQALLDKGAHIDQRDESGSTPLHNAIIFREIEVAKTLIRNGANIYLTDKMDKTPLQYATKKLANELRALKPKDNLIKW